MGKFTGKTIKIVGWEKYNGRKDVKTCTWFRLENSISTSEAFFGLDADERYVFIEICAQASRKQSDQLKINEAFLAERCKAKETRVESAIIKLIENNTFVLLDEHGRICTDPDGSDRIRTDLALTDRQTDITNKTDITDTTERAPRTDLDLESIYRRYPRKEGKSKGMKRLRGEIKTPEDFERAIVAVENYSQSRRGQDPQFTKHFSTFVSEWRDWVTWRPSDSPQATPQNPAYRRMAGNQHALREALKAIGEDDEQAS